MAEGVGDIFQRETKYTRKNLPKGGLDWENEPEVYKEYAVDTKIKLPAPTPMAGMPVDEALRKRRSIRQFSPQTLSREELSYLLWASTGIRRRGEGYDFRTAPSAGALYPVETYLVVNNVEGVPAGVYHYSIKLHVLEELRSGSFGEHAAQAALGQRMCMEAAVVFIWTGIFQRSKWKYKQRAYRYVYLDAGHIAENLALAATSLGLGSCHIGAIFDEEVNDIVGVDGVGESAIYMTAVGWPR
jgi:SagB-type dehydrogenase family enzyme